MLILGSSALHARDLSEEALFHRCYAHLARASSLGHPSLTKIRAGTSDALTECKKLLDQTQLRQDNGLLVDPTSTDSLRILNNLNRVHNHWFKVHTYALSGSNTHYTNDMGEASLYLTRILFTDRPYSDILTEARVPMGLRDRGTSTHITVSGRRWDYSTRDENGNVTVSDVRTMSNIASRANASILIQRGDLKGVQWRSGAHAFDLRSTAHLATPATHPTAQYNALRNLNATFANTINHRGGGVIGLPSYYMLNHASGSNLNGGTILPRKWARNLISDLLCRDIPVIRLADVKMGQHVDKSEDQKIAYRRDATCMRCHASIDPMASTVRNFHIGNAVHAFGQNRHVYYLYHITPSGLNLPISSIKTENGGPDNTAYRSSNPTGDFYFRTYDGKLINKSLNDHRELAQALLDTDDLYVCAARKYFEHFTGERVNLRDLDPNEPPLNEADLHFRRIVVELGLKFKKSKNLKSLIKDILDLPLYRKQDLRVRLEDRP